MVRRLMDRILLLSIAAAHEQLADYCFLLLRLIILCLVVCRSRWPITTWTSRLRTIRPSSPVRRMQASIQSSIHIPVGQHLIFAIVLSFYMILKWFFYNTYWCRCMARCFTGGTSQLNFYIYLAFWVWFLRFRWLKMRKIGCFCFGD